MQERGLPNGYSNTTFQTHYIADEMLDLWQTEFNVVYQHCEFLANVDDFNAYSMLDNNLVNATFVIGDTYLEIIDFDYTSALPDIIAHEMTHALLHDFDLDSDQDGNRSLHEGICDMFAVYLESIFNDDDIDWSYGDDHFNGEEYYEYLVRDFSKPNHDCFTDVVDLEDQPHTRSDPLRYWFYLCVAGDTELLIPSIDAHTILEVIIDVLAMIPPKADYEDLMHLTVATALERYGRCSNEFLAIARAWEAICVPTGFGNAYGEVGQCNFSLDGPNWVCEEGIELDEDEWLKVCLVNAITTYHYTWTLIGQNSSGYESVLGMSGNSQNGGTCIELIEFPEHNYYPQTLTIKVYCSELGSQYTAKHTVTLYDCEHDDPTCEEYYGEELVSWNSNTKEYLSIDRHAEIVLKDKYSSSTQEDNVRSHVVSLTGQIMYSGDIANFDWDSIAVGGMYFIVRIDRNDALLSVKKIVYIK